MESAFFGALTPVGALFILPKNKSKKGKRMKKLSSLKNLNYTRFYGFYKMIPLIYALIILVGGFLFGIFDAIEEITDIGDTGILAVVIWTMISVIASAIVLCVTALVMSPTIVRTDATVNILNTLKHNNVSYAACDEMIKNSQEDELSKNNPEEKNEKNHNALAESCKKVSAFFSNLSRTQKIIIVAIGSLIIGGLLFIYIAMGKGLGLR